MRTFFFIISLIALNGCSVSAKQACQDWLDSEAIHSSYERCVSCAKTYGTKDVNAVRSCAFKREIEDVRSGVTGQ